MGVVNILDKGKFDKATLKLHITHLTDLYYEFEEYHDELDPNDSYQSEVMNIQELL